MIKPVLIAYGLFLLLGGFFGLKAGSKMSIIMSLLSSALIFLSIYYLGINMKLALTISTSVTFLLTIVFLIRLIKTQSFMPSGMLLIVTGVVFAVSVLNLLKQG